jgi:undecaprenyl diphosphate synthase
MKKEEFVLTKPLNHLAVIMDGNGRWAKKRLMPRTFGHKNGCEAIIRVLRACREFNINYVSLYAFSTENWKRDKEEVSYLMELIDEYFTRYQDKFNEHNVRVIVSGFKDNIPENVRKTIEKVENATKDKTGQILNICFNYGSQKELVMATKAIAKDVLNGKIKIDDINEDTISNNLFTREMPPVDLMVRSSGEQRISNFLLYQIAYAELYFTKVYWPDFDKDVVYDCLKEFESRQRRFGGA